jgi:uncharacterized Fe-S cluster-containing radical SAM superfamily protein
MIDLPFDPIKRAQEVESIVMRGLDRKYHRFRAAPYYGGIATADAVGCCFLCAYCWSYFRILKPEEHGRFYSPQEVSDNLLEIAHRKGFKYCRITGCEPILGEVSLEHLVRVLNRVLGKDEDLTFVLETNGFLLGYYPDFAERLKIPRLTIRVALKGWDEQSFQDITGADKKYFKYPILGLKNMIESGLDAWPAVMWDCFGKTGLEKLKASLKDTGIKCKIETEELERYPYVLENIRKRKISILEP